MKKLYAVTLEIAINVVAEGEEDAVRIARRSTRDEDTGSYALLSVKEGVIATGWSTNCIPYGASGLRTLGEWLTK